MKVLAKAVVVIILQLHKCIILKLYCQLYLSKAGGGRKPTHTQSGINPTDTQGLFDEIEGPICCSWIKRSWSNGVGGPVEVVSALHLQ